MSKSDWGKMGNTKMMEFSESQSLNIDSSKSKLLNWDGKWQIGTARIHF